MAMAVGGDWKAMYKAAVEGDLEQLEYWLGFDIDLDYQHNEVGTTLLIAAAAAGHRPICERLLAAGATLDVRSEWDGWTAAQAAGASGHKALAEWLAAKESKRGQ